MQPTWHRASMKSECGWECGSSPARLAAGQHASARNDDTRCCRWSRCGVVTQQAAAPAHRHKIRGARGSRRGEGRGGGGRWRCGLREHAPLHRRCEHLAYPHTQSRGLYFTAPPFPSTDARQNRCPQQDSSLRARICRCRRNGMPRLLSASTRNRPRKRASGAGSWCANQTPRTVGSQATSWERLRVRCQTARGIGASRSRLHR